MTAGRVRPRRAAVAVVAGLLLAWVPAVPADAGPGPGAGTAVKPAPVAGPDLAVPGGFGSWAELDATQQRLNAAAGRVVAAAGAEAGYAGVTVPTLEREVRLRWKGAVPAQVTALAARLTAAGTPVRVRPARHSAAELAAARVRLERAALAAPGAGIVSVGARADGSGLDVGVTGDRAAAAALAGRLAAGVPVALTTERPALAVDSWNDSAPWWGGSRISVGGGYCTSGFPVRRQSDNHPFVLVSAHCVSNGTAVSTSGGAYMGTVTGDQDWVDTALVDVTQAGGSVWAGSTVPTYSSRTLVGAAANYVGNIGCSDGSYSGERCRVQIVATGVTISVGYLIYDLVRAEQLERTNAGGNGDSGGPVTQVVTSGQAYGVGTLTAIDRSAPATCTGVPGSATRSCSWRIWYAPLGAALTRYGLLLRGS